MKRLANILAFAGLSLGALTVVLDYLMAAMLMDDAKSPAIAFKLTVALALSGTLMVGAAVAAFLADSNPKRRAFFFLLAASFVGLFLATRGGGLFAKSLTGGDEPARASPFPSPNTKYRFTSDWVTRNETLWREHLGHLQAKSVRAVEIGSFEGRATIWLLENILTHPDSRITTIDPFFEQYGASQNYEERFDRNLEASGLRHKVEKIKGYSHRTPETRARELRLRLHRRVAHLDGRAVGHRVGVGPRETGWDNYLRRLRPVVPRKREAQGRPHAPDGHRRISISLPSTRGRSGARIPAGDTEEGDR